MKHFTEEELIAYQLHDSPDESAIRRHVESCAECGDLSESIAETLRVFSADPVPQPDLERNWHRLRGNLTVLTPEPRSQILPRFPVGDGHGPHLEPSLRQLFCLQYFRSGNIVPWSIHATTRSTAMALSQQNPLIPLLRIILIPPSDSSPR